MRIGKRKLKTRENEENLKANIKFCSVVFERKIKRKVFVSYQGNRSHY